MQNPALHFTRDDLRGALQSRIVRFFTAECPCSITWNASFESDNIEITFWHAVERQSYVISSPTHASTIQGWVSSGDTSFTGWMPMTGFGSECVSRCTSVYTTWHLDTCRHSANPCPAFLVVVTYARLVVVNWTFHVSIWLRTGDGRLPTPVPHLGTLYLTVSSTLILLCKPSNAISRPSYFPHTSTFISARLRLITKTRYVKPLS